MTLTQYNDGADELDSYRRVTKFMALTDECLDAVWATANAVDDAVVVVGKKKHVSFWRPKTSTEAVKKTNDRHRMDRRETRALSMHNSRARRAVR